MFEFNPSKATTCLWPPGIAFKVPEAPGGFRPAVALRRAAEVHLYLGDGMMGIHLRFVEGSWLRFPQGQRDIHRYPSME